MSWTACISESIIRVQEQTFEQCQKQIIMMITIMTRYQMKSILDKDNTSTINQRFEYKVWIKKSCYKVWIKDLVMKSGLKV